MKRTAPMPSARSEKYWHSGADGKLRICRCQDCGRYMHPPMPSCPKCYGQNVDFDPVSGKATIHSFTINRYQWRPNMPPPYVVAEVELVEQEGLKLTTNIVDADFAKLKVGMPVSVKFEQTEDFY